jgi:hypothetical protein
LISQKIEHGKARLEITALPLVQGCFENLHTLTHMVNSIAICDFRKLFLPEEEIYAFSLLTKQALLGGIGGDCNTGDYLMERAKFGVRRHLSLLGLKARRKSTDVGSFYRGLE